MAAFRGVSPHKVIASASTGGLPSSREAAKTTTKPDQKWLDVEARMLSNWQEFVKHRQEVQLQLQSIHETLLKAASTESAFRQRDREFEAEVSRCSQRLLQLTQAQDGLATSFDKLHSSVENSQETLRDRFNKKIGEVSSMVDGHQRETSKVGDALVREATDAAKRTCRSFAEELLRKMEELNAKLGENMASLEEESTWALQRVQQDVKDLATKMDGASFSTEAEVRKLEARLESTWRMRIGEVETQLQQTSDQISRAERDAGNHAAQIAKLEGELQEYARNSGACERTVQSLTQRIEWSCTKIEEVQADACDQIARVREDNVGIVRDQERAFHKALDAHLDNTETHMRQLRIDVSNYMADASSRADALLETSCTHDASIASLRSGLNVVETRFEEIFTSLESTRDTIQEDSAHSQLAIREELSHLLKQVSSQFEDRLDTQSKELRALAEPLRSELSDLRSRHQADISDHKDRIEQLKDQARKAATVAESELRKRAEQFDQTLKQLREMNEQKLRSSSSQLTEHISEVRDQTQRNCREQIDEFVQISQTREREFQHDLEKKIEALQAALHSQTSSLTEQSRRLCMESSHQNRALVDEAISKSTALVSEVREKVSRVDAAIIDLRMADDILRKDVSHREEAIERQHVELSSHFNEKVRDLYDGLESLRNAEHEHSMSASMTSKLYTELAESKSEYGRELDTAKKSAQRQLEEAVARLESRIEATSSACSKGLLETRAAVRASAAEVAEKAEKTAISNSLAHCDTCFEDLKRQLSSLRKDSKDQENQFEARLSTLSQDTGERLRQHKDSLLQQIVDARTAFEEQLRKQQAGTSELHDQVVDTTHKLTDHIKTSVSSVEERAVETIQKRYDFISKELANVQTQVSSHREQFKDDQRSVEDRIALTVRTLTQEVSELQSASRSHEEKISCHHQHLSEESTSCKKAVRCLGDDIVEVRKILSGLSERMESQKRHTIDLQENTAENLVKRLQEHTKDIFDLKSTAQSFSQNRAETSETLQKMEVRSAQMVRELGQEVADLQTWKVAEVKGLHALQQEVEECRLQHTHSLKITEESLTDQLAKLTEKTTKRISEVSNQCTEQLDARARELRSLVDPLVDTYGRHQADLVDHRSKIEQLREQAQKSAAAENDFRKRADHMEHALKQLRESNEHNEARSQNTSLQLTDQICDTREQVQKILTERVQEFEQHVNERIQEGEHTSQARTRELQHELESKIDTLQSALSLQTTAANDQSRRLSAEAIQQSRAWIDEAFSKSAALVSEVREKASRIDIAFVDYTQADALFRKDIARQLEATERQHTDSSTEVREKLTELHERCAEVQANMISKMSSQLAEFKDEHNRELGIVKKVAQEQLEDAVSRFDARLEVSSLQLIAARAAAQDALVKSEKIAMAQWESGFDDVRKQLVALQSECRERATQHDARMIAISHEVDERTRQHKDGVVQQITDVKIGFEEQLRRQQAMMSEQLTEVHDKVVERLRQQMTTQTANLEEATVRLTESMKTSLAVVEDRHTKTQEKKEDQYAKEIKSLQTLEDKIAQAVKSLTQEVSDLKSTTANLKTTASSNHDAIVEDVAATKQELRLLGKDVVEGRRMSESLSERLDGQRRESIDLQESSAAMIATRLQEHSNDITELRTMTRGVNDNLSQAVDSQKTSETQTMQLVRKMSQEVAALQTWKSAEAKDMQSVKEELTSQKFEHKKEIKIMEETLFEKITKLTEKTSENIADARTTLTGLVRNTHETLSESTIVAQKECKSMSEDLQRLKDKHEVHRRDVRSAQEKLQAALREVVLTTEKNLQEGLVEAHRRFGEVETMASQPRIMSIIGKHSDGLIRTVVAQELQVFQREALDSVEWKLERCVQWLHGANVKLGLNPSGTMFSTDRFRQMLFDEALRGNNASDAQVQAVSLVPGAPTTPRSRRRAHSVGAGKSSKGVRSTP